MRTSLVAASLKQEDNRDWGKKSVAIVELRENEGSDQGVACIVDERSTNLAQLTYVKVKCTCKLGDMSSQARRRIKDDS